MTNGEIASCEDAIRLLASHLDGELEEETHAEVEAHLRRCRSCYSRAEFEKRLKEKVAASGRADVRPELRARVHRLVSEFDVSAGGTESD